MPFYVSPEQAMKDKADYARKNITRARSGVVIDYDGGILFVSPNPSRALHKFSEMYDRIAFAAAGRRALRRPDRLPVRPPGRHRPRPGQLVRPGAGDDLHREHQAARGGDL